MSVTFTEREALRQMIEYIKEERARLLTEYSKAVSRLHELDKIEGLHTKVDNNPAKNTINDIVQKPSEEEEEQETFRPAPKSALNENNSKPKMSLLEAIELHNQEHRYNLDEEEGEEEQQLQQSVVTKVNYDADKEYYKDFDAKNKPMKSTAKSSKYRDVKSVARDVVSILKEAGRPMRTKDILTELEARGISTHSPYGLLNQVQGYEPRIEKAKFGYYQYRA